MTGPASATAEQQATVTAKRFARQGALAVLDAARRRMVGESAHAGAAPSPATRRRDGGRGSDHSKQASGLSRPTSFTRDALLHQNFLRGVRACRRVGDRRRRTLMREREPRGGQPPAGCSANTFEQASPSGAAAVAAREPKPRRRASMPAAGARSRRRHVHRGANASDDGRWALPRDRARAASLTPSAAVPAPLRGDGERRARAALVACRLMRGQPVMPPPAHARPKPRRPVVAFSHVDDGDALRAPPSRRARVVNRERRRRLRKRLDDGPARLRARDARRRTPATHRCGGALGAFQYLGSAH